MSSLVTNLNSSTAQKIVNWVWVTTADVCVHTADATRQDIFELRRRRRCLLGINLTV